MAWWGTSQSLWLFGVIDLGKTCQLPKPLADPATGEAVHAPHLHHFNPLVQEHPETVGKLPRIKSHKLYSFKFTSSGLVHSVDNTFSRKHFRWPWQVNMSVPVFSPTKRLPSTQQSGLFSIHNLAESYYKDSLNIPWHIKGPFHSSFFYLNSQARDQALAMDMGPLNFHPFFLIISCLSGHQ